LGTGREGVDSAMESREKWCPGCRWDVLAREGLVADEVGLIDGGWPVKGFGLGAEVDGMGDGRRQLLVNWIALVDRCWCKWCWRVEVR